MYKPSAGYHREPAQRKLLLSVKIMIEACPVVHRGCCRIANESVLVLKTVAEGGHRPTAFHILTLVFESRPVDVGQVVKRKSVNIAVDGRNSAGIIHRVRIGA